MPRRSIDLTAPLDLVTVVGLHFRGRGDPTGRVSSRSLVRATRTIDGPATLLAELQGTRVDSEAWGPGADRALEALPAFLGLQDDPTGFDPSLHRVVAAQAHRRPHLRIGWTGAIFESLLPAILEQKVTGGEAVTAFRGLIAGHGEPAPGPIAATHRLRTPARPRGRRRAPLLRLPSARSRAATSRRDPTGGP